MKILITIILFCIPLSTNATYEQIELIFMLQDMWVFTEDETFNLIFNDILECWIYN